MELYEITDGKLKVYHCHTVPKRIQDYKESLKEKIGFYDLELTNQTVLNRLLRGDELNICFLQQEHKNAHCDYAKLYKSEVKSFFDSIAQEQLKEQYIQDESFQTAVARVFILEDDVDYFSHNLLFLEQPITIYSSAEQRNYYYAKNILCLPDTLAALQLFEQNKYTQLIYGHLLDKVPYQLYDIEQTYEYSSEILQHTIFKSAKEQINQTGKILQKVRERGITTNGSK